MAAARALLADDSIRAVHSTKSVAAMYVIYKVVCRLLKGFFRVKNAKDKESKGEPITIIKTQVLVILIMISDIVKFCSCSPWSLPTTKLKALG